MTIHLTQDDMAEPELFEDDDMARRISQRDIIRASLDGKPAKKIVARAVPFGEGRNMVWRAEFAIPGAIPDYSRANDGQPIIYHSEAAATSAAMAAAIHMFNQPREILAERGNSRFGSKAEGNIRPAKMTPEEMSTAMRAIGLSTGDMMFLLDKPANRILDWSNAGDIPHEARLLLETWEKFDETVDFAFERTNAAVDEAKKKKGR